MTRGADGEGPQAAPPPVPGAETGRGRVYAALRRAGGHGVRAFDLCRELDMGLPALAAHLDSLTFEGHVVRRDLAPFNDWRRPHGWARVTLVLEDDAWAREPEGDPEAEAHLDALEAEARG